MREEIVNWWKQAQKDIKAAANSLQSGDYEWACFQAQQSVEKAFKALLLKEKKEYFPTHNLITLGKEANAPEDILKLLREITPEYTITRYPNAANAAPYEIYDKEIATKRIKQAEIILSWIRERLNM